LRAPAGRRGRSFPQLGFIAPAVDRNLLFPGRLSYHFGSPQLHNRVVPFQPWRVDIDGRFPGLFVFIPLSVPLFMAPASPRHSPHNRRRRFLRGVRLSDFFAVMGF
jgi:hypothetical protein